MIIVSKFKDYYDFLVGKYGRDEKVIYNRGINNETIFPCNIYYNTKSQMIYNLSPKISEIFDKIKDGDDYNCFLLVICGKIYFLKMKVKDTDYNKADWNKLSLILEDDLKNEFLYNKLKNLLLNHYSYFTRNKKHEKDKILKTIKGEIFDENLLKISIKIENPIFLILTKNHNQIVIHEKTPILKDIIGISGLLKPEDIYQQISYFMGNILNKPKEEVKISDNSKIIKAGFDLKTSFRNV